MEKRIWKVRIKKTYPEATNHVVVGEVLEITPIYLEMKCKAFHFKKPTIASSVLSSLVKTRIFPWHTVSYITVLDSNLDWESAEVSLSQTGDIVITSEENAVIIGGMQTGVDRD